MGTIFPAHPVSSQNVIELTPTGTASVDKAALVDAIGFIQTSGIGSVKILEGEPLAIDAYVYFGNVSLLCQERARVSLTNNSGFVFGVPTTPTTGGTAFAGLSIGATSFVIPAGMTLAIGDYVAIRSADSLNSLVQSHEFTPNTYPLDLFKVIWVTSGGAPGGTAYLDGAALETMTTSAFVIKMAMSKNVQVENVEFIAGSPAPDISTVALTVYQCANARVRNVTISGFPGIHEKVNYGCLFDDCVGDNQVSLTTDSYTFLSSVGSHNTWRKCIAHNGSHCFTTGGFAGGGSRYGTLRGLRYEGCKVLGGGSTKTTAAHFDTHAEGVEITYNDCEVHVGRVPGTNQAIAFSSRARRCKFNRCKVFGDTSTIAFQPIACGNEFDGCYVERATWGIRMQQPDPTYTTGGLMRQTDSMVVKNCTFYNVTVAPITIDGGRGHRIVNNRFLNCAATAVGSPDVPRSLIHLENTQAPAPRSVVLGGSAVEDRIVIRGNEMDRDGNIYSVSTYALSETLLEITGNWMRGQGVGLIGNLAQKRWLRNTAYSVNDMIRVASGVTLLIARSAGTSNNVPTEPTGPGNDNGIDWAHFLWIGSTPYSVGNRVKVPNGKVLQCSGGGTSASSPAPTGAGPDGGVTWIEHLPHEDVHQTAYGAKNYTD